MVNELLRSVSQLSRTIVHTTGHGDATGRCCWHCRGTIVILTLNQDHHHSQAYETSMIMFGRNFDGSIQVMRDFLTGFNGTIQLILS